MQWSYHPKNAPTLSKHWSHSYHVLNLGHPSESVSADPSQPLGPAEALPKFDTRPQQQPTIKQHLTHSWRSATWSSSVTAPHHKLITSTKQAGSPTKNLASAKLNSQYSTMDTVHLFKLWGHRGTPENGPIGLKFWQLITVMEPYKIREWESDEL